MVHRILYCLLCATCATGRLIGHHVASIQLRRLGTSCACPLHASICSLVSCGTVCGHLGGLRRGRAVCHSAGWVGACGYLLLWVGVRTIGRLLLSGLLRLISSS